MAFMTRHFSPREATRIQTTLRAQPLTHQPPALSYDRLHLASLTAPCHPPPYASHIPKPPLVQTVSTSSTSPLGVEEDKSLEDMSAQDARIHPGYGLRLEARNVLNSEGKE